MKIGGVEILHPDKVIFPEKKLTKLDVARYYEKIADKMLPYLKDRPLTLQRFPNGIKEGGFYQKNAGDYFPKYIHRVEIETSDGINEQVICNDLKSLIYLVNQGVITFHTWLSREGHLHYPDKIVFDLDPPENGFSLVKKSVLIVRKFLREQDVEPQLMTSGKNGFHLYYATDLNQDFDKVRENARSLAEKIVAAHPNLFTIEMRKEKRKGRIFLDYLRNAYGQTSICPYSLRPVKEASVATPIKFRELSSIDSSRKYTVENIFRRLAKLKPE